MRWFLWCDFLCLWYFCENINYYFDIQFFNVSLDLFQLPFDDWIKQNAIRTKQSWNCPLKNGKGMKQCFKLPFCFFTTISNYIISLNCFYTSVHATCSYNFHHLTKLTSFSLDSTKAIVIKRLLIFGWSRVSLVKFVWTMKGYVHTVQCQWTIFRQHAT